MEMTANPLAAKTVSLGLTTGESTADPTLKLQGVTTQASVRYDLAGLSVCLTPSASRVGGGWVRLWGRQHWVRLWCRGHSWLRLSDGWDFRRYLRRDLMRH